MRPRVAMREKDLEWKLRLSDESKGVHLLPTRCDKFYSGGAVKAKNCLYCEHCIHGYELLCLLCGEKRTLAGADILDMICKKCFDAHLGVKKG